MASPPARVASAALTRRYVLLVATLSLLWGASYLFIKIAGRELQPATMMLGRVVLAAAVLIGVVWWRGELRSLRLRRARFRPRPVRFGPGRCQAP